MASTGTKYDEISVIGAGAWGTALATVLTRPGRHVTLWARETDIVDAITQQHENPLFLPDIPLPPTLRATTSFEHLPHAQAILMVAPAQYVRTVLSHMRPHVIKGTPIILCSKGIEQATGQLMSEVLAETLPDAVPAVLSGPSFAKDVARGLPTAVTLATADPCGHELAAAIGHETFRVYYTDDVIGAEIGGAVKNVLAIACGIVEGRKLGDSARAALIARGFAEVQRLAASLGARSETLEGLSGLGDLILTCTSRQSRNMSLGVALGEGQSLQQIMAARNTVAEGVHTAAAVAALAARRAVDMPICQAIDAIVADRWSVTQAIHALLSRPVSDE